MNNKLTEYIFPYLSLDSGAVCGVMIIALALSSFICAAESRNNIQDNVVRLHILAESDSESDQALKLKVRDAVLEASEELFKPYSDYDEAVLSLSSELDSITEIAEETLRENGCSLPVATSLEKTEFDRREYGNIAMPSGEYTAVRIEIGSGEGHNWWCVMYPPLCVPCISDEKSQEEILAEYGEDLSEQDISLLLEESDYEVRFYIWDKLCELSEKIKGTDE